VVDEGALVGPGCRLVGVVVGDRGVVGEGCELTDGARVWCDAELPAYALRFSPDESPL
jgi:mannose-1-phosphate guanylyltransferase